MESVITIKMPTILTVRFPLEPIATTTFPFTLLYSHLDTDSEGDIYPQRYEPSSESLAAPRVGVSEFSTPTIVGIGGGARGAFPAWSTMRQTPLSEEEIGDIFWDLTQKFGFQKDSTRNMVCSLRCNTLTPD